jgi:hypothetical protein
MIIMALGPPVLALGWYEPGIGLWAGLMLVILLIAPKDP